jgi:hypothetical protein
MDAASEDGPSMSSTTKNRRASNSVSASRLATSSTRMTPHRQGLQIQPILSNFGEKRQIRPPPISKKSARSKIGTVHQKIATKIKFGHLQFLSLYRIFKHCPWVTADASKIL